MGNHFLFFILRKGELKKNIVSFKIEFFFCFFTKCINKILY
jgi:hypothetical protein